MFILTAFLPYREAIHSDFSRFGMQTLCILLGKENSFARYVWFHNAGLSFLKMKSNYSMTAVFTGKEGSPDRRHEKMRWVLDFLMSPSLCFSSISVIGSEGSSWHSHVFIVFFYFIIFILDCNLHRSLWSSCMDVPVPKSELRSGGWGRGGRGASCGLHFLWRENPARLSQEWSLKALTQCCFLFVHQVPLAEGDTISIFLNLSVSGL